MSVAPGSVGIAGNQTGIYSLGTPGGWNLVGRTPLKLFTPDKNPPVLLRAGDRVKFRTISSEEFAKLEAAK
jgi:inhibitor of KinA